MSVMQHCRANGINFHIQLRSLNWREIDARADAIVSDPKKRVKWRKGRQVANIEDPEERKPTRKRRNRWAQK